MTPVFLLSGIATLLQLFNSRLARVADDLAHATDLLRGGCDSMDDRTLRRQLLRLTRRMWVLDASIALGAFGGATTCGAAFILFLGAVRKSGVDQWLIWLFAIALACTIGSLVVFLGDSILAWIGLRNEGPLPRSPMLLVRPQSVGSVGVVNNPGMDRCSMAVCPSSSTQPIDVRERLP